MEKKYPGSGGTEHGAGINGTLDADHDTKVVTFPQRSGHVVPIGVAIGGAVSHLGFQLLVRRIHALGERALGELLVELDADPEVLREYAALDRFSPKVRHQLGVGRWPAPLLMAVVTT